MSYMKNLAIEIAEALHLGKKHGYKYNDPYGAHPSHDIVESGDGYEEPLTAYCDKCYGIYDRYRDGKHNDWIAKRCPMRRFGWHKIFERQLLWYWEWRGKQLWREENL